MERDIQGLDRTIFRAYDIRGIANESLFAEHVCLIGKALGSYLREQGETKIAMGRDGRLSSLSFSKVLAEGLKASGCDVIDVGLVPTPMLYFAAHTHGDKNGIMLTGSHNPPSYNGLKMMVKGAALTEADIQALYERIIKEQFVHAVGSYCEIDVADAYIEKICADIKLDRPLTVVVDAGNGAASVIAGNLFKALGCEVHELFCSIDGNFPNHHPDPSQPENLQALIEQVKAKKADVGLAFDGDGDRLGIVTNQGEIIFADRMLMLFSQAVLKQNPKARIIYDVKCTHHLHPLIHALGGEAIMWKTGHSHIKSKLAEIEALLAGEMSGHFFFKDRWFGFDDALYAGARALEIFSKSEKTCSQLFSMIPNSVNTPELKVSVDDAEKFSLMEELSLKVDLLDARHITKIDGLRVNFAEGWGLVRPSNTTPFLILRFEAINEIILKEIQTAFREWMLNVKPDLVLPF